MRHVGRYARIIRLATDIDHGSPFEEIRRTALGRICRIVPPHEGTSDDGNTTRDGWLLIDYACISNDGISHVGFYARESEVELVDATEELLILYSEDLWQLVAPFGEPQVSCTFEKLVNHFGLSL